MNLKKNIWMYLFFASALLWVGTVTFSCEAAPEMSETADTVITKSELKYNCGTHPDSFQLKPIVAGERIGRYEEYAKKFPPVDLTKLKPGELVNPDVRYFQLPRCELDYMLQDVGEGADVKVHLAIKNVAINGVSVEEIVLVFEDTANGGEAAFYDFVHPCPPKCPK
jgi:hypothetical protein